jgi:hypothetical protein
LSTSHTPKAVRSLCAALLLFSLLASQGCRKPEDGLDHSLLNPSDTLGTFRTDTTSIIAWPKEADPIRTSGLSANLLGSYVDDRFGTVTTGIATQLRLSVNNVGPADPSLLCDSLVLALAFSGAGAVYGDLDPQIIKVYRLTQDLLTSSIYNRDSIPATDGQDLVQGSPHLFTPSPDTGPEIGGDSLPPELRIPLRTDLGNELLSQWGQATLANNTSFLDYFKGLYIVPDNDAQMALQGGVWSFNLVNGASKMTLYYHDANGAVSSFDFIIGAESQRYTTAVFDHSTATVPGVPQALADTTLGQVETCVQGMGSIRTEIRFPFLDRFAEVNLRAVAKAELIVPIAGEFHDTYTPPTGMFAFRKGDDGSDKYTPDQRSSGLIPIPISYDAVNKYYRFNLTRWVQGVVDGTYANTGLSLVPDNRGTSVARAVIGGASNPDTPMELVITFTTY